MRCTPTFLVVLLLALGSVSKALQPYNLSEGRTQLAAATAGNFAIFAGGYTQTGNDSDAVDILDSRTWTWSTHRLSIARGVVSARVGSVAMI